MMINSMSPEFDVEKFDLQKSFDKVPLSPPVPNQRFFFRRALIGRTKIGTFYTKPAAEKKSIFSLGF